MSSFLYLQSAHAIHPISRWFIRCKNNQTHHDDNRDSPDYPGVQSMECSMYSHDSDERIIFASVSTHFTSVATRHRETQTDSGSEWPAQLVRNSLYPRSTPDSAPITVAFTPAIRRYWCMITGFPVVITSRQICIYTSWRCLLASTLLDSNPTKRHYSIAGIRLRGYGLEVSFGSQVGFWRLYLFPPCRLLTVCIFKCHFPMNSPSEWSLYSLLPYDIPFHWKFFSV